MSAPAEQGVQVSLLADQVFVLLRDDIVNGRLAAGERLRVREVANRVGTSIMPVREAIRRLEEAGLVDRSPHRGAVVRGATFKDLLHIYDIRLLLEADAAARGSRAIRPEQVDEMAAACRTMEVAVDEGRLVDALDDDEALLRVLYGAQDNHRLIDLIEDLWRKCRVYKVLGATTAYRKSDNSLWQYQRGLVEAARSNDADRAATITRESLRSAQRRIEETLRANEEPS